jgi:hypothetical protein
MPAGSGGGEQPVRPPNFFGAYDPAELESLLEHHRTHFGERAPAGAEAAGGDAPVQGGGGLHELVMDALRDQAGGADVKE